MSNKQEEEHYKQWKARPKDLKREMAKEIYDVLRKQHI